MQPSGNPGCLDEDAILAFVAGSLSAERLSAIERHLADCRDCSWLVTVAVLATEEPLRDALASEAPSDPSFGAASAETRFEELELIAEGAMGAVYRGIDAQTGSTVAIKRLKRALIADHPDVVERFTRESEILRRLDHPNIVKIIASVDGPDEQQIVMEYVPGGSLRGLLQAQGRIAPGRAVALLLELTDALARAHHLDVTHRDIKPENVLLAADGTPRLSDFGLSRLANQEGTSSAGLVGTLPYLSPEALSGAAPDPRADLWALGVTLFEILAGERPFRGDNPAAVIRSILFEPAPDLAAACPEAPAALTEIAQRLLARNPEQRIGSARQLGAMLEAVHLQFSSAEPDGERPASGVTHWLASTDSARPLELASLPRAMTPFIGRKREVESVLRWLRNPALQLVTLTGPGGMGKSRVALEVARRLSQGDDGTAGASSGVRAAPAESVRAAPAESVRAAPAESVRGAPAGSARRARVCFVDLISISDPKQITSAIGAALGFAFPSGAGQAGDQLCAYLREKELLLLLDNFEHVLPAAPFISQLLQQAPGVKVLATSREPLHLAGETQFALGGMDLEDAEASERGLEPGAVELFLASARRVRADFNPSGDTAAVLEICRAVHGMPLGILLASSWVAVLAPREIADEIRRSPDFLRDDRADLPSRQRSLRAVFDHSWSLLQPADRETFARLSAFRGSFTRAAADRVAGARLDNLAALVAKSLLEWQPSTSRYVIHELLRQYADERLAELPGRDATMQRLGEYYSQFLAERERQLQGLRQRRVVQEITAELGNIRSALQGLLERRDLPRVAAAFWALCVYHRRRGARAEVELLCAEVARAFLPAEAEVSLPARRLTGMALAVQALHGKDQGKRAHAGELMARALDVLEGVGECRERALALIVAGWVMNDVWSAERCLESAERGLQFYRGWGNGWSLAEAVAFTAQVHLETAGDPRRAEALLRENLELQRSLNDGHIAMPTSLCLLGLVVGRQGDWREGCELILQGLEVGEQLQDVWAIEGALRLAARAKINLGELAAAARYARRCMKLCRETGALESVAWCKFTLAEIAKQCGQLDESAQLYAEARDSSPPDTPQLANAVMNLGDIALLRGELREAERCFKQSLAAFEALHVDWGAINALDNLGHLACQERHHSDARAYFERALELALSARRQPLVLNAIVSLARLHGECGHPARAVELLGWAQHQPALHHQTRTRHVEPRLLELARQLPSECFEVALARGARFELETAWAKALEATAPTEQETAHCG